LRRYLIVITSIVYLIGTLLNLSITIII